MIYLLLFVDDMLVATKSKADVARFQKMLNLEFDMKDLGANHLGIKIFHDQPRGKILLTQKCYIKKICLVL